MSHLILTPEQIEVLLETQDGCCAICETSEPGGNAWHLDHDRTCCPGDQGCFNCVRGLLCQSCRFLLADPSSARSRSYLKRDPGLLEKAFAYLDASKASEVKAP